MLFLQLNGVTDEDRQAVVARLSEAVGDAGAWIVDHRAYSDLSLCLVIELEGADLAGLWQRLTALPIRFDAKAHAAVAQAGKPRGTVKGTLEIRFTRGTGDLSREVPAVPG